MLTDTEILLEVGKRPEKPLITPFDPARLQSVSVDLLLGPKLNFLENKALFNVMTDVPPMWEFDMTEGAYDEEIEGGEYVFCLHPGQFALGHTIEWFNMPRDIAGRLDGKSSLGRLGLMIHITAGLVDPGFEGQLVLELRNVGPLFLCLKPNMKIAQISFERLAQPAHLPYGTTELGSKYQHQEGPVGSRYHLNYGG